MNDTKTMPKPDVRFYIEITHDTRAVFSDGGMYARFTARLMVLSHDPDNPGLWSPDSYSIDTHGARHLEGLEITAQTDNDAIRRPGGGWYGWSVHYARDRLELPGAEDAVKVLRAIDRRHRKLSDELGRPETLAQFCAYVTGAVTREPRPFLRKVPADQDYDGTGYRPMTASALDYHITSQSAEIRKAWGIEPPE